MLAIMIGLCNGLRLVDVEDLVRRELKPVNVRMGMGKIRHRDWVGYDIVDHYCRLEGKKPSDVGLNEDGNIEYCLDVGFLCLDDP